MIIEHVEGQPNVRFGEMNLFPDPFVSDSKRESKAYIKSTLDYFYNVAIAQTRNNRRTFVKNYDLVKGIRSYEDYYNTTPKEAQSFVDQLLSEKELPDYVRPYNILVPPLNTMVGELSKRPDIRRVRAFDDDSRSEEFDFKTGLAQQLIIQKAKEKILYKLAANGEDIEEMEEGELQELTINSVKDQLTDYTSLAERWGNHITTALKAELSMKDKSEEAFRDLLIATREYFHIYKDNSKLGFNVSVENPKNVWKLSTPDRKYTSDPSGRGEGAYAIGTAHTMEISEIIEKHPWLTEKEINHLRESREEYGVLEAQPSNLFNNSEGINSIKYDTYSKLEVQERMMADSTLRENKDDLTDWLGLSNSNAAFGYKYTVLKAYWQGKKKIGGVTYLDENGDKQFDIVDESYTDSPNQTGEVEWGWVNQWYEGCKIGNSVYYIAPFELLDYAPIIGVTHEIKNTEAKGLIDQMKSYQMIHDVAMNQLWRLLEKEIGVVYNVKLRKIPTPKDGDAQDAIEMWEEEARRRGIIFEDDSPENMKSPMSNTDNSRAIDLTRTAEIQSRYELAARMKLECWELVGMNRQRLGSSLATQTATANQNDLAQSFAQTEPYFSQHEYLMDQVYQAMLDAAQHIQSKNPFSTVNYITSEGESAFMQVTSDDIKMRDLKIFNVSRPEDQKLFSEIRQLSQPMLQNGADAYDILELYSTNSMRQMKKTFKDLKEERQKLQQQAQEFEQQKLQQEAQIAEAELKEAARQKEIDRIHDNYNQEQKRLSDERRAIIQSLGFGKVQGEDTNANAVPDVLETTRLSIEQSNSQRDFELKLRELDGKQKELKNKRDLELEKLKVDRENMKNDEKIARINAKAKAKSAAKKSAKKK